MKAVFISKISLEHRNGGIDKYSKPMITIRAKATVAVHVPDFWTFANEKPGPCGYAAAQTITSGLGLTIVRDSEPEYVRETEDQELKALRFVLVALGLVDLPEDLREHEAFGKQLLQYEGPEVLLSSETVRDLLGYSVNEWEAMGSDEHAILVESTSLFVEQSDEAWVRAHQDMLKSQWGYARTLVL